MLAKFLLPLLLAFSSSSAQSTLRGSADIIKIEDDTKPDPIVQSFVLSALTEEIQ